MICLEIGKNRIWSIFSCMVNIVNGVIICRLDCIILYIFVLFV